MCSGSRICWRYGSAFSGRESVCTAAEFARRTLRTDSRLIFSTRAISRLLTPWACNSRIVVRWFWLNMLFLLWDFGNFAGQTMEFLLHLSDPAMDLGALEGIEGHR